MGEGQGEGRPRVTSQFSFWHPAVDCRIMVKELLRLPAKRLKRVVEIKSEIERLEDQLENLIAATTPWPVGKVIRAKRRVSAAARRKISLAAKNRWAKWKAAAKGK